MNKMFLNLLSALLIMEVSSVNASSAPAAAPAMPTELKSGLRVKPPYYIEKDGKISGIDAEIGEAVMKKAGIANVSYGAKGNWEAVLGQLKAKTVDFMGDGSSKEELAGIVFSSPYRKINYKVISAKGKDHGFKSVKEFMDYVSAHKDTLKVGYVDTVHYPSEDLLKFFKTPDVKFEKPLSFAEVLDLVFESKVDYAVIDEMHANCVMDQKSNKDKYDLTDIGLSDDRQFMLLQEKVGPELFAKINQAIDDLKKDGSIDRIINQAGRCVAEKK